MSGHTPGPWIRARGVVAGVKEQHTVVLVGNQAIAVFGANQRENADLAAAAPELLVELIEARTVALALWGAMPPALQKKWPGIVARARALEAASPAITKALRGGR